MTNVARIPCAVHPLHLVDVRVGGGRAGCPMCAMQVEDLCRSLAPAAGDHAPVIARDMTRIVGCTCGWRVPSGTADSDEAIAWHCANVQTTGIAEGAP